jgi:hypothetical protein
LLAFKFVIRADNDNLHLSREKIQKCAYNYAYFSPYIVSSAGKCVYISIKTQTSGGNTEVNRGQRKEVIEVK